MIEVRINQADIVRLERLMSGIKGAMPKVMSRGLNNTNRSFRTRLKDYIAERTGLKKGVVLKSLLLDRATYTKWRAALKVTDITIPVIKLNASQTKTGVTYKSPADGQRKLIEHAFIATGAIRGKQVWLRLRYLIGRVKMIEWHGRNQEAMYIQKDYSKDHAKIIKEYFASHEAPGAELAKNILTQVRMVIESRK